MLARALLIALSCAYAAAIAPLSAAGDDNECALYLTGPGRTSAYDYSLNLLKGNFGYEGQHTCITYDAVNQAYLEARNRIVVSQPKGDWKAEDYASVGELMLDISTNLARTYGLTYEEIEKGLPLIDTSRTLIREVCPPTFSHVECRAGKYRRFDGLCTNLHHPTWGATMSPFQRLIGPLFADGINAPRIAHTGRDLPLSRVVSRTMHPDDGFHDHAGTVMVIAWGQFMDHDYTLTGTPLDPVNRNDPEECCKRPPHLKHPYCNEIRIPDDDYFYRLFGVKCIDFVRGFPSPRPGCRLGSRVPFNTLTGVIDGNTVYGVTEKFARKLRTGYGGLLRMNPVFKEYGLKDLLPLKLDIPDEGCTRPNKNMYCFEAGEIRVNEQLVLTVMHTLMAREHNRVARGLAEVNSHWDDETLFQEARRINIAEIQHITYNEFLPILLGKDVMEKFGLVLQKDGYWNGHDPDVNPDVIDAFAAAAYRFGHSLLPTAVERWSKAHKFIASKRLSDLIRRPYDLYRAGVLDEYVMGLMNQVAQAMDDSITQEVTNHLFKKVGARFGMDLVSFNMQRGREFGLPGYMEFRKFCGLSGAETFQDLFGSMPNDTVRKYESIFEHPVDVDLWSGGVSERPLRGSMLGPTFACIIATQFSYSRRGDRFWYELPNQPSSFTPEQLTELKKSRLARVICDNTDIIDTVQLYPMVLPDHELNPRVPCRSGIIPSMDFTKWAEPAPFHGPAKQFMTDAHISAKNITNGTEVIDRKNDNTVNKTITLDDTQDESNTTDSSNTTANKDSQNNAVETKILTVTVAVNITANNNSNNVVQNCVESKTVPASKSSDNFNLQKETINDKNNENDKVLKYVYNNDKNDVSQTLKGHPKNSLKRRKRSDNSQNSDEDVKGHESKYAPLIVNYETSHNPNQLEISPLGSTENIKNSNLVISQEPSHIEIELPIHERATGKVIKNANLADFNIETLHEKEAQPLKNNGNLKSDIEIIDVGKTKQLNKDSEEINDRYAQKDDRRPLNDSEESTERKEYSDTTLKSKPHDKPYSGSRESKELDESEEHSGGYRQSSRGPPTKKENTSYRGNSEKERTDFPGNYREHRPLKSEFKNERKSYKESEESTEKTYPKYSPTRNPENYREHRPLKSEFKNERKSYKESEESTEKTYPKYSPTRNQENFESNEKGNVRQDKKIDSNESQESYESKENHFPINNKLAQHKLDSSRSKVVDSDESNSKSKESGEADSIESSKYSKPQDYSDESKEKYNEHDKPYRKTYSGKFKTENKGFDRTPEYMQQNSESSNEKRDSSRENYKNEIKNRTTPLIIQDVDLGDFSYERIEVNDKSQVVPAKDSSEENISTSKSETLKNKNNENISSSVEDLNSNLSAESKEDHKSLIKINAGEIKPVVEINADTNSDEFISKEPINANLQIKDTSLEAFLGVKDSQENDQNEKIKIQSEENKGDVKQQFERIPLNYKHDENTNKQNHEDLQPLTTEKSTNVNTQVEVSEGTIEIVPTDEPKYDENLKFKFDDVPISLPEIKLPENILAYTYEEPHYEKQKKEENQKRKYYPYESFVKDDDEKNKKPDNDDKDDYDDDGYDRYYGNYKQRDNYKKKNEDEEEVEEEEEDHADLYEKFVRERFGKQGTFAQRSEKLQNPTPVEDPHLYERIKNVLKKTHDIEKQAQKSGDPNAGYMWTLEYGQNL